LKSTPIYEITNYPQWQFFKKDKFRKKGYKMKYLLIFLITFTDAFAASAPSKITEARPLNCLAAREYITTIQFFKQQSELALNQKQILKYADLVSRGCTGASERFIKVTKLLTGMGIDTKSSIDTAGLISQKTDDYSKAFIQIFKYAYHSDFLNLDARQSMKIATELSTRYNGDINQSIDDFKKTVELCLHKKSMQLTPIHCAQVATQITKHGQDFQASVFESFADIMIFLQYKKKGPGLDRKNALKIALNISAFGPKSGENFKQTYRYAVSKKGLAYNAKQAITLANKITARSFKIKSEN
jgi:hypothetical protein